MTALHNVDIDADIDAVLEQAVQDAMLQYATQHHLPPLAWLVDASTEIVCIIAHTNHDPARPDRYDGWIEALGMRLSDDEDAGIRRYHSDNTHWLICLTIHPSRSRWTRSGCGSLR